MLTAVGVFTVRSVRLRIDAYTVRAFADSGEDFLTTEGAEGHGSGTEAPREKGRSCDFCRM